MRTKNIIYTDNYLILVLEGSIIVYFCILVQDDGPRFGTLSRVGADHSGQQQRRKDQCDLLIIRQTWYPKHLADKKSSRLNKKNF